MKISNSKTDPKLSWLVGVHFKHESIGINFKKVFKLGGDIL